MSYFLGFLCCPVNCAESFAFCGLMLNGAGFVPKTGEFAKSAFARTQARFLSNIENDRSTIYLDALAAKDPSLLIIMIVGLCICKKCPGRAR